MLSVVTDRKLTESGNSTIASQDFNSFSNGSAPAGWSAVGTGATPSVQNGRLMVQATSTGTAGVSIQVSLLANRSYAIQMYIAPPASSMPVSYTIKDGAGVVLAQQSAVQAGNYTLNITPTAAGLYTVGTSIAIPGGNGSLPPFYIDDYNATLLYQDTNTGFASMFKPDVVTYNDYYPFGMLVPNRHANTSDYRYGFNGMEKDDELKGEGNSYDYEKRFYDPRIGRFLSIDPLDKQFPWYTPYQFAGNTPVNSIDLEGLEEAIVILEKFDDQGNAVLSITRNDHVMNNSNEYALNIIFKDKYGNQDTKLIQQLQRYDATIRRIIIGQETSPLQRPDRPTYDYSLTVSQEGIKQTSARIYNVDNGIVESGQRAGFNSGEKTFSTTKLNAIVLINMSADSEATGGGGHKTAKLYIENTLSPAFRDMDTKLSQMNITKDAKLEINLNVDEELYNNKAEFNNVEQFIRNNYPNADVKRTGNGSGAHILLQNQKISKEAMDEYNKTSNDENN